MVLLATACLAVGGCGGDSPGGDADAGRATDGAAPVSDAPASDASGARDAAAAGPRDAASPDGVTDGGQGPGSDSPRLDAEDASPPAVDADHAADAADAADAASGQPVVSWSFNGATWSANGAAPACPDPLVFPAPVPIASATAVLYPGQTRGGHYKAHGGFLFAPNMNAVTVRAPMSGYVLRGVRYVEAGEVQYLFDVVNGCGVMHRFDHLLTLSPRFAALADMLPPASTSSATTPFTPGQHVVSPGEIIATAVGFAKTGNASVDWGVYDLRKRNAASADASWLAAHPGEQAPYALCWLDHLPDAERTPLRALPGGDGAAGKTSDYCN